MLPQPVVLPFPGYPYWRLFFCTCWLAQMPDGQPKMPQHVEAAQTIDPPTGGQVVVCRKCDTVWYAHSSGAFHRLQQANVRQAGSERKAFYFEGVQLEADAEASIEQTTPERLAYFEEGNANDLAAHDQVGRETEFDH